MPPKKRTTETFKQEMMIKYNGKVEITGEYLGGEEPIDFIYHCDKHGMIPCIMNAKNISSNRTFQPCKACGNENKSENSGSGRGFGELFIEFDEHVKSKGGKLLTRYWNNSKGDYTIKCDNPDHLPFINTHDKIMHADQWCPYCCGREGDFQKEFKDIVESNDGELLSEYQGTFVHLKVKCNKHNHIWNIMPLNLKKGRWCPVCNMPMSEKVFYDLFKELGYKFDIQYTFPDLISDKDEFYKFDFAIFKDDRMFIVESDGSEHRRKDSHTWYSDIIKNEYCKNNDIKIIRIPFYHHKHNDYDMYRKYVIDNYLKEIQDEYNK